MVEIMGVIQSVNRAVKYISYTCKKLTPINATKLSTEYTNRSKVSSETPHYSSQITSTTRSLFLFLFSSFSIVDDGTGAIQCVMWIPDNYLMVQDTSSIQGLKVFSLGDVVRVKGYLEAFRDSIQIDAQPGCIGMVSVFFPRR